MKNVFQSFLEAIEVEASLNFTFQKKKKCARIVSLGVLKLDTEVVPLK